MILNKKGGDKLAYGVVPAKRFIIYVREFDYQTSARCSSDRYILSPFLILKALYHVSIMGRAAITRRRLGE